MKEELAAEEAEEAEDMGAQVVTEEKEDNQGLESKMV